jgi:hypothetical protein
MCFRKKGNIATENSLYNLSFLSFWRNVFRTKENAGPGVHIVLAFRRRAVGDGDAFVCLKIATKAFSSFHVSQPRSSSRPSRYFSHVPLLDLYGFW